MLLYRPDLVGTDKRTRQKELHRTRLEQARKEAAAQARRRRIIQISGILLVGLLAAGAIALFTGGDDTEVASDNSTTSAVDGASTTVPTGGLVGPGPGASITGSTPCPEADGSSPRTTSFAEPPPMCIDPAKSYSAAVSTTKGDFTITLEPERAPITVNNFVVLSRYHFYDGIPFHRIIADFVVQAGDPSDVPAGTGGPGYSFEDELPEPEDYGPYSLAMANSGADTNGSQFFIVVSENGATSLTEAVGGTANYSLFGTVTAGMDVVDTISRTPVDGDRPTEQVDITSITITES
jgi:cyclophilin family peptidyl-prolyl cis-trans isomerase